MSLFNVQIDAINLSTIQSLIGNVREGREIEFKRQLNISSNSEKKEFLADVVSFATASGGDIIIGVNEVDGIADSVTPLEIDNIDAKELQIAQIIRGGISPRINFNIHSIECESKKYIILIRVFKSFQGPAMITFESPSRFYSRNSSGKYPLDHQQIKDGFLSQATYKERFIKFKNERTDYLLSGDEGNNPTKPFILLFVYPLSEQNFNVNSIPYSELMNTLSTYANDYRYNLDGFKSLFIYTDGTYRHTQIFTNAIIETYDEQIIAQGGFFISGVEGMIIDNVSKFFELYKKINVIPPFIVSLGMFNFKNLSVFHQELLYFRDFYPPKKNYIHIPEIVLNSFDEDLGLSLKPIFDGMWRAFGAPQSANYHGNGLRKKNK